MINRAKLQHILEYAKQQRHIGLHCKVPPEDMVEIVEMAMHQGADVYLTSEGNITDNAEMLTDNLAEDGNSPVIPDGWVACSERMPEREIDVQVYCSDKKEQMVGYMERNERDGYFRFASLPNGGGVYCQPTHWMPLPAAPQQEVKP